MLTLPHPTYSWTIPGAPRLYQLLLTIHTHPTHDFLYMLGAAHPERCILLYSTLLYSTLLNSYSTLLYSTLLYSTLLY